MSDPRTRSSAYADLVAAMLGARSAPATGAFDAALAEAEAAGRLDPATARTLRYWQRASVAEVVDHAVSVLPAALVAGDEADAAAAEAAADAAAAWERARVLLPASDGHDTREAASRPAPADDPGAPGAGHPAAGEGPVGAARRRLLVAGLTVLPETGDAR